MSNYSNHAIYSSLIKSVKYQNYSKTKPEPLFIKMHVISYIEASQHGRPAPALPIFGIALCEYKQVQVYQYVYEYRYIRYIYQVPYR